ncbi:hypothetical protein MRX96_004748 [Rhipicephalus microplus]
MYGGGHGTATGASAAQRRQLLHLVPDTGSCWLRQQPAADGLPRMLTTATRASGGVLIAQRTINRGGSWREVLLASRRLDLLTAACTRHTDRAANADGQAMVYGPVDGGRTTLPPAGG